MLLLDFELHVSRRQDRSVCRSISADRTRAKTDSASSAQRGLISTGTLGGNFHAGSRQPVAMLVDNESLHVLRRIAIGAGRVLHRREYVGLRVFDDERILGMGQQIENEPLEFERVRFRGIDAATGIVDDAAPSCERYGMAGRPSA